MNDDSARYPCPHCPEEHELDEVNAHAAWHEYARPGWLKHDMREFEERTFMQGFNAGYAEMQGYAAEDKEKQEDKRMMPLFGGILSGVGIGTVALYTFLNPHQTRSLPDLWFEAIVAGAAAMGLGVVPLAILAAVSLIAYDATHRFERWIATPPLTARLREGAIKILIYAVCIGFVVFFYWLFWRLL